MEQEVIEWANNGKVLLGFMVALVTAIAGVATWFWNRVSSRVKSETSSALALANAPAREVAKRVTEIESEVSGISDEVHSVKRDIKDLSGRVQNVERSMETVARQSDLAALNAELKLLTGTVTAELRALSGTIHSFREAALRSSSRGKQE